MAQQALTVTQVNEYIRTLMDRDNLLNNVCVKGEISNYKLYPSGHHYFTLKDENGALRCVMFKGNAFRLRFRPENGMKIVAMGKIGVFPRDGAYQLYCTSLMPDGVGDLHVAFEQLKAKLSAKGLFDPKYKKPIPKYPGVIGIVTSPVGAALQDMLRILNARYPLAQVRLIPARVQGAEAPGEIAGAIDYANRYRLADVLIVGRGGGSIEDLWAFNDEKVAYAIFRSQIPVISAVGHEPDVTISDYVADLRAATPSNAAELVVPDCNALRQMMDGYSASMSSALGRHLKTARQRLNMLSNSPAMASPLGYFEQRKNALHMLETKLSLAQNRRLHLSRQRFTALTAKLDAMSPLKVLTRGYAMVQGREGQVIRSAAQVSSGDYVSLQLSDGKIEACVTGVREEA
ncbi:MAG: exodeoxyribonuclease VII large subunit [Faecousia sp.]